MFNRLNQKSTWVGAALMLASFIVSKGTLDPQLLMNVLGGAGLIAVDA